MLCSFNYVFHRLNNSIDSDDIINLGLEIETLFDKNEVRLLKKMLKDPKYPACKTVSNTLHIRYLINYLSDEEDFH